MQDESSSNVEMNPTQQDTSLVDLQSRPKPRPRPDSMEDKTKTKTKTKKDSQDQDKVETRTRQIPKKNGLGLPCVLFGTDMTGTDWSQSHLTKQLTPPTTV